MFFSILGIIIFLSGLSVIIIINNSFSNVFSLPKLESNNKIAVLTFTNDTGNNSLNIIGNMTENWISHGITENNAGQIISQNIVKDYTLLNEEADKIKEKHLKYVKENMNHK